jgi:hypothetical protein
MPDYFENPAKARFRNAKVKPWDYWLSAEELALFNLEATLKQELRQEVSQENLT